MVATPFFLNHLCDGEPIIAISDEVFAFLNHLCDGEHEVIYETAQRIGTWELSTKSEKETWAMWKDIYPKVCQEHASGIDFTLPVEKRLEQVQPKPATAEQADEYLDRIKKMLGGAK